MMARRKGSVRKKSRQQQSQLLKSRIEASETRALSESARVYCAGYRSESNKAAKGRFHHRTHLALNRESSTSQQRSPRYPSVSEVLPKDIELT